MESQVWWGRGWSVAVTGTELQATYPAGRFSVSAADLAPYTVRRSRFRWALRRGRQRVLDLRGISKSDAADLEQAVRSLALQPAVARVMAWHAEATRVLAAARSEQRWITTETLDALVTARPDEGFLDTVRSASGQSLLTPEQREAVAFVDADLSQVVSETNGAVMAAELSARRSFFDTIEQTPLTDEQARAVVCFDNRVQVLAAAGSGKTSVMVARAAYAVSRGLVKPERILLLAFNRAAADELQERVNARFAEAGVDSSGVQASTFHSFGLDVIGRATGKRPRLARGLDQGDDIKMVERIVDGLRDSSPTFRIQWDLYRLLFGPAPTDLEEHEPDGYDKDSKETGYQTFKGDIVKSHGERLIADFLYLNGVNYSYEQPYCHDVSDATHSEYRPDFYYPDIDAWHEHWALGRDGRPPYTFAGYAESMAWKRQIHADFGTTLLETTWADVVWGDGLTQLGTELTSRGLTLDWNPDRPRRNESVKQMRHEDLYRLVRSFMTHVKSNSWTREDLEQRLEGEVSHLTGYRTRLFLELYWPIHLEWERQLAAEDGVDFEDMLVQAAQHLEAGHADMARDLVMVDEFQDVSRARARLVRGLLNGPGRYLLAVGDDWQSINRFAGADLSVMTEFGAWFGRAQQLSLTTTFRCPQAICDVASGFVAKNPRQFDKPMRSAHPGRGAPVQVRVSSNPTEGLRTYLDELSRRLAAGEVPAGPDGRVTVDVLGRYSFDRELLPVRRPGNLEVTFRTIHGSKGLEADYVVLPNLTAGTSRTYGFPSNIVDDPVLHLAMPAPDLFPHAEERRLFYVALTRARRAVALIVPERNMSAFVVELLKTPDVTVVRGAAGEVEVCPECGEGTLVVRQSVHGEFYGCSTFPKCRYTRNLAKAGGGRRR